MRRFGPAMTVPHETISDETICARAFLVRRSYPPRRCAFSGLDSELDSGLSVSARRFVVQFAGFVV